MSLYVLPRQLTPANLDLMTFLIIHNDQVTCNQRYNAKVSIFILFNCKFS